jgi:hypothetical protein
MIYPQLLGQEDVLAKIKDLALAVLEDLALPTPRLCATCTVTREHGCYLVSVAPSNT